MKIYVAKVAGRDLWKIGLTEDPKTRIQELAGYFGPVDLVWSRDGGELTEQRVQDFWVDRLVMGEWYDLSGVDVLVELDRLVPLPLAEGPAFGW